MIRQGDVFWLHRHPHVVVQNNVFNQSKIQTVVVCALTSNLQRAAAPGNVLLRRGEANLPKRSVVNIPQLFTVDKTQLSERIGTLSSQRLREILEGMVLLLEPREPLGNPIQEP